MASYIKSAFRNLLRDKTNALISVTGLAVGMACCMLIGIHIRDEFSYNSFNSQINNIYRINWITKDNHGTNPNAATPVPFAKSLSGKIPEIEKIARLYQRSGEMEFNGSGGKKRFQEQGIYFADNDVLGIFTMNMLAGDPGTALATPNSIVVTDEMARKYFGEANPIGQSLLMKHG
jgi:putative ABC transport system permease protein